MTKPQKQTTKPLKTEDEGSVSVYGDTDEAVSYVNGFLEEPMASDLGLIT